MYLLYITAYDNAALPMASNSAQVVIQINNLDDNIPVFCPTSFYGMLNNSKIKISHFCVEFTIQENATVNSTVGFVKAADADTPVTVKYSVTDLLFKFIYPPEGRLVFAGTLEDIDFETTPQ